MSNIITSSGHRDREVKPKLLVRLFSLCLLAPGLILLFTEHVWHFADFARGVMEHDPAKVCALALTLGAICTSIIAGHMGNMDGRMAKIEDHLASDSSQAQANIELRAENDRLSSNAMAIPDHDLLWRPKTGTVMYHVHGRFNDLITTRRVGKGYEFTPTYRMRENAFPRVEVGRALSMWYVTTNIPDTDSPFSDQDRLIGKKILFTMDNLRQIAKVEDRKECIDQVVRIIATRRRADDLASWFCLTVDTPTGPRDVVYKYYRHPGSNLNIADDGELIKYSDAAKNLLYRSKAQELVNSADSMTLTVEEFRKGIEEGIWPTLGPEPFSIGDHIRL